MREIEAGVIEIVSRDEVTGEVAVRYTEAQQRSIKTSCGIVPPMTRVTMARACFAGFWAKEENSLSPSLYATRDAVATIVRDRHNALIVDSSLAVVLR